MNRIERLDESSHLRFKFCFPFSGTAGGHGSEGSAVIALIKADKFIFFPATGLLEILADKFHGRFG